MKLFNAICDHNPSDTAIVFNDREITYGELRSDALGMLAILINVDVERGDRVALLLNDSPEFVQAFLAITSMGAIVVPINMGLAVSEQCSILHNSGARVAVIESEHRHTLLTGASEKLQALGDLIVVERDEALFEDTNTGFPHVKIVLGTRTEGRKPLPVEAADPDDPALLLYTSGSTGEPKGAIHTENHIFSTNDSFCREVLNLTTSDRLFSSSRLPFAYGFGNSFSFPLLNGATTILCREKPTPQVIARIFREHKPTIFFGVPVVYNLLLDHHRREPLDCSSLRLCVSAGEALPAHLGEAWQREFGVELLDGIGSTEMLHMFMSNHSGEVKYGSSGKLLDGYEARLLDESGQAIEGSAEGNLWIKGDSAALGYWNKPVESERT